MKTMKRIGVCAAVLGAIASLHATEAAAQGNAANTHGCSCLHNNTASTIHYRFRWGDRDWKKVSLSAGGAEYMCWAYKDAPKSPELQFQLDVDMTSGKKWETFDIPRVQTKAASCAATGPSGHYHVGYVANSNKKKIQIYNGAKGS